MDVSLAKRARTAEGRVTGNEFSYCADTNGANALIKHRLIKNASPFRFSQPEQSNLYGQIASE